MSVHVCQVFDAHFNTHFLLKKAASLTGASSVFGYKKAACFVSKHAVLVG